MTILGLARSIDISLLGETIPHYRLYRSKVVGGKRIFLILQSAFKDAGGLVSGFNMVASSLELEQEQENSPGN